MNYGKEALKKQAGQVWFVVNPNLAGLRLRIMPEGNLTFGNVSGNVTIQQAGSNIIAGNQAVLTALRQQTAQQTATAPYKFLASYDISDRDIFFGRDAVFPAIRSLRGKGTKLVRRARATA